MWITLTLECGAVNLDVELRRPAGLRGKWPVAGYGRTCTDRISRHGNSITATRAVCSSGGGSKNEQPLAILPQHPVNALGQLGVQHPQRLVFRHRDWPDARARQISKAVGLLALEKTGGAEARRSTVPTGKLPTQLSHPVEKATKDVRLQKVRAG